ncbi:MAG: FAD:protein FMN transferase [Cyclobacteriaceae bacterium]|nr:FAD:protein FMN transferase [Cyclobacteriaceae bacterium]
MISFGCKIHNGLSRYDFSEPHMGSLFKISLYANDSIIAKNAARDAFQKISALNLALSDYDEKSETWQLNADRTKTQKIYMPGDDLWQALLLSEFIHVRTHGAFDPTIGSLVRLWRRSRRRNELPSALDLEKAQRHSGFKNIRLVHNIRSIEFYQDELVLDFGAIGKGIAADEVAKVLKRKGIKIFLIDAGGDLLAGKAPPRQKGWRVELQSAAKDTMFLQMANIAIATSGDLYQYVEINGIQYSHIIDPRDGYALQNQAQATVITSSAAWADALASAFCILSYQEIEKISRALKKTEYTIMRNELGETRIRKSKGFSKYVIVQ